MTGGGLFNRIERNVAGPRGKPKRSLATGAALQTSPISKVNELERAVIKAMAI